VSTTIKDVEYLETWYEVPDSEDIDMVTMWGLDEVDPQVHRVVYIIVRIYATSSARQQDSTDYMDCRKSWYVLEGTTRGRRYVAFGQICSLVGLAVGVPIRILSRRADPR
jgi:hypothetical protein